MMMTFQMIYDNDYIFGGSREKKFSLLPRVKKAEAKQREVKRGKSPQGSLFGKGGNKANLDQVHVMWQSERKKHVSSHGRLNSSLSCCVSIKKQAVYIAFENGGKNQKEIPDGLYQTKGIYYLLGS